MESTKERVNARIGLTLILLIGLLGVVSGISLGRSGYESSSGFIVTAPILEYLGLALGAVAIIIGFSLALLFRRKA